VVISLSSHIAGEVRRPLLLLFGAVGFLLLIVCVNVANLLLVRVTARARELAVRAALGAGRRDLIRQVLTESLLLALAGGIGGVLLANWSMDLLRVLLPADMPRAGEISIDAGVIGFGLVVSAGSGLVFGLLPAWRASSINVNDALKAGSRTATAGKRSQRTQAALVISEACLSLVLVVGAGLLVRSFSARTTTSIAAPVRRVAESARGIAPRAAHRTVRKPLDLHGSCDREKAAAFRLA